MSLQQEAATIAKSKPFQWTMTILGIFFIFLTFAISLSPQSFLQFGYLGVLLFNVVSSGLLLMPIITEKLSLPLVVLASALGNIPNTSVNYLVGNSTKRLFSGHKILQKIKTFMKESGLFAVYILAMVPFPIDINGLLAGYLDVPFKKYILVNFLGKVTIFYLVGLGVISVTQFLKGN